MNENEHEIHELQQKVQQHENRLILLEEKLNNHKDQIDTFSRKIADLDTKLQTFTLEIQKSLNSIENNLSAKIQALEIQPSLRTTEAVRNGIKTAVTVVITAVIAYMLSKVGIQ